MSDKFYIGLVVALAGGLIAANIQAQTAVQPNVLVVPADGNEILNPGFEVGLDHWVFATESALDGLAEPVAVTNAVEGKYVLRVQLPEKLKETTCAYLSTDCIRLDGPGTFSVYLRSDDPVQVTLGLHAGSSKNDIKSSQRVELGPDWKRLELSWASTAPYGYGTPWIQFASDTAGRVEVDAAQYVGGAARPVDAPQAIQCGFYTDIVGGVLVPGAKAQVGFNVAFSEGAVEPETYELRCTDQDGTIVAQKSIVFVPADGTYAQVRQDWVAPETPGLYRWTVRRSGVEAPPAFGSYDLRDYTVAVVQPPHSATVGEYNFFSTCLTPVDFKLNADRARALGMTLMRLHFAVSIAEMDSFRPGLPLDRLIDYPHSLGMSSYFFPLDHHRFVAKATENPAWLERFTVFCKSIFSHYRGKIQACEFWNEPAYKLSLDQVGVYNKIQEAIQTANAETGGYVKMVDLCGVPNGQPFNQDFIDRVAASPQTRNSDALALHFYMNGRRPEELLPVRLNSVRSALDSLPGKEVWDTESGYITRPVRPFFYWMWLPDNYLKKPWESSHWSVRHNLMEMQFGLRVKTEFLLPCMSSQGRYFSYGMFKGDSYGGAELRVVTYAAMSRLLARAQPVSLYYTERYGSYAAEFVDLESGRTVLALWQAKGEASLMLNLSENSELFDVYGRTVVIPTGELHLSEGPIYLVCDKAPELPAEFRRYDLLQKGLGQVLVNENVTLPPNTEWELRAADCGFMLEFEPKEKVLQIDAPLTPETRKNILVWDVEIPEDKSGMYIVWGAVDAMFSAMNSDLTFQLDDQPIFNPQAMDQPLPVSVSVDGKPMVLGWEKLAEVELPAGHHQLKLRAAAKVGSNRLRQCVGGLAICPVSSAGKQIGAAME
jgi:hypothetical protein